ncbi:MAG TPA: hypothetical protein VKT78_06935, partial [Fimbriimonadaceae bacterium]|nr:hypothetical protein [Fimbriimonadaceae bacterium]
VLILVWVVATAASVASEASKADQILKDAESKHVTQAEVDGQLRALGFELTETPMETQGKGPVHSLLVYSTRLTVRLGFDEQGHNNAYRLDRE